MKKLKLLFAACALLIGWSNASAYQTPEANGIYYLYNTACTDGNPGFMSTGNGYGFQVVIDNFGFPVKLISVEDGKYRFQFVHHEGYLSDDGFMYSDGNTDRARTITIQDQGEGKYKLLNTNNSKEIEDWYGNVVGDGTGNRHNYLWQFMSKAERDAIVAGYTTSVKLAAATSMGMPASVDTEEKFDEYLSTNYIGIDQSTKITNGTFDTSHNTEGWTTHNNDNRSFKIGWGNADPKTTPEVYEGAGYIDHTSVSVDKAGLYKVSVNAAYRCGNSANNNRIGDLGYDGSVAYLQANNSIAKISDWYSGKINGNGPGSPSEANSVYFAAGKYLTEAFVYVGDAKTIDISLHSHAFTWGGWLMFNNFKLTYYSDEVSEEDATEILNQANALADVDMLGTIKTALTDAKNTFDGARTIANYNALNTAIDNANVSKNAYANAKAYLDGAETVLEGTNVYTTSAYNTYYATPKAAYDAKTLTNEEANALTPTSTGWHSANTIDDILLSAWTIGGEQCKDYDKALYINTWSVEGNTDGSNFFTPFFEYWVADGSLGANTIQATVTGLKASTTYSFTIRARVSQTNGQTKIANGITMKVGEGEAVDISAGAKFNDTQFFIGNFSAVGETDAEGRLTATITVAENSNVSWLSFYNAKYTEGEDLSAYIADYEFAKSTAIANRDNAAYSAITGKEKTDLVNAITTYSTVDETSKSDLIAAKEALEAASNTFVTAAPAYTTFAELNTTVASTLGVALPTITSSTTAADLDNEAYIVAEYTAAKTYAEDFTDRLGAWTNAPGTNSGESWDGSVKGDAEVDEYYDLYNNAARAMTQTVTLPAGDYALIAKGRASVNGRLTVVVGGQTVTFPHKGSSGRGIATNGDATFDPEATYANSNNGRGWEYRVITFTSDGSAATTLTFNWTTASSNWCGLDDIELYCNPDYKSVLNDVISNASAISDAQLKHVGYGVFQINPVYDNDFYLARKAAKDVYDDSEATIDEVKQAISDLNDAIDAFNNVVLNVPDPAKRYSVKLTNNGGWTYDDKAITYIANARADMGNYNVQYQAAPNANLAQAFTFTQVSGNTYKMSQTDVEGNTRYLCTGVPYSGNASQIRTTTEANDALVVEIRLAGAKNVVNIYNTAANNYIGSQDAGVYTVNSHINFTVAEASQATVDLNISSDVKYATRIFPFAPTKLPNGVVAYTCNGADENNNLTLDEADVVEANVPYILYAENGSTGSVSGWGVAAKTSYTAGWLTGVYSDTPSVAGNYVLQNQEGVVAFYQVTEEGDKPVIGANRCYLTVPAESEGRAAYFFGGVTGVENVEAASEATLKDGKYLVKGQIVIVKNGVKYNAAGAQVK